MGFLEATDISFVLSGGSANNDPNLSLGGPPSSVPIMGIENNLFPNVEPEEVESGLIDHRCFYIFNDSIENSLFSAEVFFESDFGGATIEIGVSAATDLQKVEITGATGGSVTMSYEGTSFIWTYDPDVSLWGANLENGLNGLDDLSGVVVEASNDSGVCVFYISFEGQDDNRNHSLVQIISNDLSPSVSINVSKIVEGSPINSIAPQIAVDTAPPVDVDFSIDFTPIAIGNLGPGDGIPIWIRRTTFSNTLPFADDGFKFRLMGKPF